MTSRTFSYVSGVEQYELNGHRDDYQELGRDMLGLSSISQSTHREPSHAGLDVVIGYQVSWILMFADYSRYTRSPRGSATGVFIGLGVTREWIMPLGASAARMAGSTGPGPMLNAVGLGAAGARRLPLGTAPPTPEIS